MLTLLLRPVLHSECLKCESASRRFQPAEGPSRGLPCDCEIFADGSFAALLVTQQLPTDAIVIRSSLSPSFNHAGREVILNNKSIKILPLTSLNMLNVILNSQSTKIWKNDQIHLVGIHF